ncbi:hypothetical protein SS1G_13486 [Sclerotinia sclerotiorum 1980 UF-70]|uniref:Uncharacterized protein n=1 Tax=Sclerotinia sclerotiorum (strain ATCC 18683 / 1980 / Ss-1) TaxID=665079 RepID=A7F7A6_SCLS1|nr:hypothetical protein SS1G_13486 [Sclerotinia sclerotiorum 1980 UF-70]EDN98627.1 hypothetical protein SS1G_13486 [Sclerotinia sclerotiorum 1980 UF-70]
MILQQEGKLLYDDVANTLNVKYLRHFNRGIQKENKYRGIVTGKLKDGGQIRIITLEMTIHQIRPKLSQGNPN